MRCGFDRLAERARVVLSRKNSLFVGNERRGRTAAILASVTSTCCRHEVDPQLYLPQLLMLRSPLGRQDALHVSLTMNLPAWPVRDLDAWLPDQWKLRSAARLANLHQQNHTTPDNRPSPALG